MGRGKGKVAAAKREPIAREALIVAFQRRVRFLRSSAAAYDAGDVEEAYRMSGELRALLHYGSSRPLLHELGIIKKLAFVDTVPPSTDQSGGKVVSIWGGGLTVLQMTVGEGGSARGQVVPRCAVDDPTSSFPATNYTKWWKHGEAIVSEEGRWYSRAFVVTEMANTEGVHSDSHLDSDYTALRLRDSSWTVTGPNGQTQTVLSHVAAASVRQVAWETLATLELGCPELL